ncbi:hypothetical protein AOLI_G00184760 [Acnodon oligacanthus]
MSKEQDNPAVSSWLLHSEETVRWSVNNNNKEVTGFNLAFLPSAFCASWTPEPESFRGCSPPTSQRSLAWT